MPYPFASLESHSLAVLAILAGIAIAFFVVGWWSYRFYKSDPLVKKLQEELDVYKKTYLWKMGYAKKIGPYNLLSIDGGKTWYFVLYDDGAPVIFGFAEDVLLEALRALGPNDLTGLVKKMKEDGPLALEDGDIDWDLLNEAGFFDDIDEEPN